jgi:hypothetical protein
MANRGIGWGRRLPSHSTVSRKRVKAFFLPAAAGDCSLEEAVVVISCSFSVVLVGKLH